VARRRGTRAAESAWFRAGQSSHLAGHMISTQQGSIRLFRFSGIQVFLHWSWFVVAVFEISTRGRNYSTPVWNVAEYLALFAIVLLHEFGHALACRSVGGEAKKIILWPLGGIAFVNPPPRPGAMLWSIAAGPLVNVVLFPILVGAWWLSRGGSEYVSDPERLLFSVAWINGLLLAFNILPVYPLDGGQILRSLLWFRFGRAQSLRIATMVGFVGVAGLVGFAFWQQSIWMGIMALYLGQRCMIGYRHAQGLTMLARLPRHTGFACPTCHEPPPGGPLWVCPNCRQRFDPFSTRGVCPHCSTVQAATTCVHCGNAHPISEWENAGRRHEPPVIDV
jgi:Zn-dependent protease